MRIQEICESCRLTKKAVEYYERQGLIHPAVLENGYRDYSEADRDRLREIAVLRALDVGVEDIRRVLECPDDIQKGKCLSGIYGRKTLEWEEQGERLEYLKSLSLSYRPGPLFEEALPGLREKSAILERLQQAFPGTWGLYLAWHFGRYLGHAVETPEQRQAYEAILAWVDGTEPWELPEEFADLMRISLETWKKSEQAVREAMDDVEGYMEKNQAMIEAYQQYRQSEEYRTSPGARLQQWLTDFQKQSGYIDVFLKNMRKLSPAYQQAMEKMEAANARLLERYPDCGAV